MQAEERHGFEGDGFVYLRNPLWWAGIICRKKHSRQNAGDTKLMVACSGSRRNLQLCSLCLCAGNPRHTTRRLVSPDRSRVGVLLSQRRAGRAGETGSRHLPDRSRHHCAPRPA